MSPPGRRLRVGIIDLVAGLPSKSIYARIVNPNYTSVMPQFVAVWLEQMGHEVHYVSYTGTEDFLRELPDKIDVLFISTFTHAAYTAYAISNIYRKKGVVTVLGGPHARAYGEDAQDYFDYVLGLTDKDLIQNLLDGLSPQPARGQFLTASRQIAAVPGIRERWKFIEYNLRKTRVVHVVPMIGSLGCPYTCSFCIDSRIDYLPLPFDQIREDLQFLQSRPKPPIVAWYDPNFGVRFNDYLDLIESAVPSGRMAFGCESSLSILTDANLKRLKKNNFIVMLPGIESWFDFNAKSKQEKRVGLEKVHAVAGRINKVLEAVPYVQVNFIFGLDNDEGSLPFELTKRFVDLAPGAYPNYAFLTSFGNSAPLNHQYQQERRVLDIPFPFLDGNSGMNIRPKNYSYLEIYDHFIDLNRYSFSGRRIARRFRANRHPLPRWMNLLRAVFSGKGLRSNYGVIRNQLAADRDFQAFITGESTKLPEYYFMETQKRVGPFFEHLPKKVMSYLQNGEPHPNPRVANALPALPSLGLAAAN